MREVITIQIPRPNFESLDPKSRAALIENMGKMVAEQIVFQEEIRVRRENIAYWQNKMIEWQVEDKLSELKHGQFRPDQ